MTEKEFFRKARRLTWRVTWDGAVRCEDGRCPMAALNEDLVDLPSAWGASRLLGLPFGVARKIASASDHRHSRYRRWLLKNLGIEV